MALVCKECNLGIAIAKFYPQGGSIAGTDSGWGQYPLNSDYVNIFFIKHAHSYDASMWGGNQYELHYEIDENTWKYDNLEELKKTLDQGEPVSFSEGALEPAEKLINNMMNMLHKKERINELPPLFIADGSKMISDKILTPGATISFKLSWYQKLKIRIAKLLKLKIIKI